MQTKKKSIQVEPDKSTGWIEGVAIMIAVLIVVMVTAVNDKQKENQFRELQKKQASKADLDNFAGTLPRLGWLAELRVIERGRCSNYVSMGAFSLYTE